MPVPLLIVKRGTKVRACAFLVSLSPFSLRLLSLSCPPAHHAHVFSVSLCPSLRLSLSLSLSVPLSLCVSLSFAPSLSICACLSGRRTRSSFSSLVSPCTPLCSLCPPVLLLCLSLVSSSCYSSWCRFRSSFVLHVLHRCAVVIIVVVVRSFFVLFSFVFRSFFVHCAQVGAPGNYAPLVMSEFLADPEQPLRFNKWVVDDGIFARA
jgi:hypothetical protein